jgi:hypothetical protein
MFTSLPVSGGWSGAADTAVPTRGGTNQYFSIIGMLGTVPD